MSCASSRAQAEGRPDPARRSGMARPTLAPSQAGQRPDWLKVRLELGQGFFELRELVEKAGLHTVCQSATCPNIGECWSNRTLTFMILGNICTRSCGFCDVATGRPGAVDLDEPRRVAEALATLHLRYAVVTSVDRDDLPDGGAFIWAETIRRVRALNPATELEVLVPDFKGDLDCVATVVEARPHVYAHNLETVERLHRQVRPQARYERSLQTLQHARALGAVTKSGMMLGLGETTDEVLAAMRDLAGAGVEILSLGQYLRPSMRHLPVQRWVHPDEFRMLQLEGRAMGFAHVESAPLVRSSYHADAQARAARQAREAQGDIDPATAPPAAE
jgi:lipoic acid synthetase